jgi:hypothetical protein
VTVAPRLRGNQGGNAGSRGQQQHCTAWKALRQPWQVPQQHTCSGTWHLASTEPGGVGGAAITHLLLRAGLHHGLLAGVQPVVVQLPLAAACIQPRRCGAGAQRRKVLQLPAAPGPEQVAQQHPRPVHPDALPAAGAAPAVGGLLALAQPEEGGRVALLDGLPLHWADGAGRGRAAGLQRPVDELAAGLEEEGLHGAGLEGTAGDACGAPQLAAAAAAAAQLARKLQEAGLGVQAGQGAAAVLEAHLAVHQLRVRGGVASGRP